LAAGGYIIILLSAGAYLLIIFGKPWLKSFEIGLYTWTAGGIAAIALIFIAAFFVPKFWCRCFCPVGAIARLISKLKSA
jgi:polyferredoxin